MKINVGDLIFHREYGVGQVVHVEEEPNLEADIQFKGKPPMRMTDFLIGSASARVSPGGFRALAFHDPEAAGKLISENPVEVILLVLEDFQGYRAKTEAIKDYLKPYVKDLKPWWEKTQGKLKEDPRIDSTRARLQEYALAREVHSMAEEAYLVFKQNRRANADAATLSDRAFSALRHKKGGEKLPDEHYNELLAFLEQILRSDDNPLPLQLNNLFKLKELNLISPERATEHQQRLLAKDFRLFELDLATSRQVTLILKKVPVDGHTLDILSSGMGLNHESEVCSLAKWAVSKSDPMIIGRFLLCGLTNNVPPELEADKYPLLNSRFESCLELAKSLPGNYPGWPEIFTACRKLGTWMASNADTNNIQYFLLTFLRLVAELDKRREGIDSKDVSSILASLLDPMHPMNFILALLDTVRKEKNLVDLYTTMENFLLENADLRKDDFLLPLISERWVDPKEQAADIMKMIEQYNSPTLKGQGGTIICNLASPEPGDVRLEFLPYLEKLRLLDGEWSWKARVEGLRELGYRLMIREYPHEYGYRDEAVIHAAQHVINLNLEETRRAVVSLSEQLEKVTANEIALQNIISQKEDALRELKGSVGGDTAKARFEERSRILKELVESVADFERFAASQAQPPREIEAVIKRLSSILSSYRVTSTDPIGSRVPFDPQKHRLINGTETLQGESVEIIERGYFIRDQKEKLRRLKPAMVKKVP